MDVHPTKNVLLGIDPYPFSGQADESWRFSPRDAIQIGTPGQSPRSTWQDHPTNPIYGYNINGRSSGS